MTTVVPLPDAILLMCSVPAYNQIPTRVSMALVYGTPLNDGLNSECISRNDVTRYPMTNLECFELSLRL